MKKWLYETRDTRLFEHREPCLHGIGTYTQVSSEGRNHHLLTSTALVPALFELPNHGGATGLVEYVGDELCGDEGAVFVALYGTQHGAEEGGRRVLRVRLTRSQDDGAITDAVIEPFLGPDEGLGHPIALAMGPDAALYVLDFQGFVLRVTGADEDADGTPNSCELLP